jgi:hypothetical protein
LASFEQKQGYGLIRINAAILLHLANPSMTKSEKKSGNAAIKAPLALLRPKIQRFDFKPPLLPVDSWLTNT